MLTQQQFAEMNREPEFDPKVMGGSIKRKIVNPALMEERAKCDFDKEEAFTVLFSADERAEFDTFHKLIKKYPEMASTFE